MISSDLPFTITEKMVKRWSKGHKKDTHKKNPFY